MFSYNHMTRARFSSAFSLWQWENQYANWSAEVTLGTRFFFSGEDTSRGHEVPFVVA